MISLPHNILSALNAKHRTSLRQFAQHVQSLYTWTTPPEFNDHGPEHIGRVLQQFSSLFLRPARRRAGELSEFETYLAAVAIVAHDIGMIYGRDNHAAVAANILNAARQQFEYVTAGNVHVIELIARAVSTHSSSADLNSVSDEVFVNTEAVRLRRVAAAVRLSDELDEDARRAPSIVASLKHASLSDRSAFIWQCNQSIAGIVREARVLHIQLSLDFVDAAPEKGQSMFVHALSGKLTKLAREVFYCSQFLGDGRPNRIILVPFRNGAQQQDVSISQSWFALQKEVDVAEFIRRGLSPQAWPPAGAFAAVEPNQPAQPESKRTPFASFIESEAKAVPILKERQVKLERELLSRVFGSQEPASKLSALEIDCLYLYGLDAALGIKRVRGVPRPGVYPRMYTQVSPTTKKGRVTTHNYFIHGEHVSPVMGHPWVESQRQGVVDFLSVSLFDDDVPELGDWISLETLKYHEAGAAILRVSVASVRKIDPKHVRIWRIETGGGTDITPGTGRYNLSLATASGVISERPIASSVEQIMSVLGLLDQSDDTASRELGKRFGTSGQGNAQASGLHQLVEQMCDQFPGFGVPLSVDGLDIKEPFGPWLLTFSFAPEAR